jgi:alanine or glycine:cation symporter, AGCS family
MNVVTELFGYINDLTWGWALVPLLVVIGIYFTLVTGFVQFRYFGRMWWLADPRNTESPGAAVSGWDALMISVGGRVGGGNLVGVAVAITLGGPGAVFWMWAIALVGMCTSLIENTLAQAFKRRMSDGTLRGGPAAYIHHGLGARFRWLVLLYSVCLLASFGLGFNAFQGNTISMAAYDSLGISPTLTALVMGPLAGLIVFGGLRRIAKAADAIVPVMCLLYLLMAVVVIAMNIEQIPAVFSTIIANAFGWEEAVSGGMGAALAAGLKRGLFSNEAGLGSAPNVAATAQVKHPVSQGIIQSLSVFIDTMVICSCTAFIILLSPVYQPGAEVGGAALVQQAMAGHFGDWAQYLLTILLFMFSLSSIIYNYYLGETAVTEITKAKAAIPVLRIAVVACVMLGAAAPAATSVFFFSDPLMGLLAVVNLMVIVTLLPVVLRLLQDYRQQLRDGEALPVFDPQQFADLDIDRSAWKQ